MQITSAIKDDIKAAKTMRLPWWGVLCIIIGALPIYWLFDHFGKLSTALPLLNSLGVIGFVLVLKRQLRRYVWFWITMALIAALHIPLILFVPWTMRWIPALAIAAIDSVDLVVMLAVLAVVGRFMEGPKPAGT